jgi:CBS domain-containing protein
MERIQNIPKELISDTLGLDYRTPISRVIASLKKYPTVVIYKDKDYWGVVDTRTIYRARRGLKVSGNEKAENFSIKVPKITNSTSIYDLAYYFYKSGVKALPYSNGTKITGVLERKTLLKIMLSLNLLDGIQVNQAMTTPVLAIDARANVAQAQATMRDKRINRLVVLQNSKFAGLITNYDIVNRFTKSSERLPEFKASVHTPSDVPISSVMEKNVRSIEYNRPVAEAVRDMVEGKISSLIVLRNSNPIGVLTITDVFESIIARQHAELSKIFMSGFDENTYQYEDEAREMLKSFSDHIERLSGIEVDYITLKVRRSRSKLYDMQIRLSLGKHGIISMHTTKYLFEDALNELLKNLKHKVIKEKESIVTYKRSGKMREVDYNSSRTREVEY